MNKKYFETHPKIIMKVAAKKKERSKQNCPLEQYNKTIYCTLIF